MSAGLGQTSLPLVKPWRSVLVTETRCVLRTLAMLARQDLVMPKGRVGRSVLFADGTHSEIYRETAVRQRRFDDLVILAVRFRLRFIGMSHLWHFLFRVESLFNTLLFAAHRGFQTKLWLTDRVTGYYRGIYEWEGRAAAIEYLETLRVVLAPWIQAQSFGYEVIEGISREEYLDGWHHQYSSPSARAWWCPVRSEPSQDLSHG